MPANEQTWRDQKLLHVFFGVSSLVMLIATIWMLVADHEREWKRYQREFRKVETWTTQARISQQDNNQYNRELEKRQQALAAARSAIPPKQLIDGEPGSFHDLVDRDALQRQVDKPDFTAVLNAYQALVDAEPKNRPSLRDELFGQMNEFVANAKFRENSALAAKKFRAADFDVARSNYELAVGEGRPEDALDDLQKTVDKVRGDVEQRTLEVQDRTEHRKALERVVEKITADEAKARKALDEQEQTLKQLNNALYDRQDSFGKWLLELPIIDAFGRPLKPDQIWLPKLTINNNFRDVARFDRCTTCHQALDKTLPGSPLEPAYPPETHAELTMQTPAEQPAVPSDDYQAALEQVYGLRLADGGLFREDDVTVSVVRPQALAAKAGLAVGDVIEKINDVIVLDKATADNYLVDSVKWGQPLSIWVRRGLPNPYVTHPRLDLYVGSLSPHKMSEVGCTVCHEGQGSATDFKWASHTPNSPRQAQDWQTKHGWFNNHHWIFPMNPERFIESTCLKCHHELSELEPSERFPDPPAPSLLAGYNTIRQYGCFGCHEINGYDGPNRRIGPDLRTEPNYSAAAQALAASGELSKEQHSLADELAAKPEDDAARHELLESIRNAGATGGGAQTKSEGEGPQSALSSATRRLVNVLDDVEAPGKLRKVGPSLRRVADKLDYDFLYSWVRRPQDFRPNTKMPQFFGLWDHLIENDSQGHPVDTAGLTASQRFEPIEIRGVVEYLLAKSQPFDFLEAPQGVTEEPSAERGKHLFEVRGCLACHQHADFPKAEMNQGPDLSRIGAKLARESNKHGGKWLYSWLRNPSRYHPRTLMPNVMLEPISGDDGKVSDPAADIAVYLLASRGQAEKVGDQKDQAGWAPTNIPKRALNDKERQALYDLALDHLRNASPTKKKAEEYLAGGIPQSQGKDMKGDEVELLGGASEEKQLLYVGRRTISKYGCAGCHDIPGFEDAKPIGTGLADWGRKAADKLAFEQIATYLTRGHGVASQHAVAQAADHPVALPQSAHDTAAPGSEGAQEHSAGAGHMIFADMQPPSRGYFMEKLMGHEREGFIWNKLKDPRSYDYRKTENKGYNERLRMPKFHISDQQIESVITFVLGLVAEPPVQQYVYKPQPRRQAIAEGLRIVEKYNCTGCHALQMDRWKLAYNPGDFPESPEIKDYDFLLPHFSPAEVKASLELDAKGLRHATVAGMPVMNEKTGQPARFDEDNALLEEDDQSSKVFYQFTPWQNVLINGQARNAGIQNLIVPATSVEKRYPALGGYLPRLIFPDVVAQEKKINTNAKGDEAWGWLPPPLVGEGRKVQSDWLHSFLLDPYPIRPAVLLRMPKFNMSSAEATALVNYFAAVDNSEYPYQYDSRARNSQLSKDEQKQAGDALKIITDNNYCIKCHLLGTFAPTGSQRAKAPHLDEVYKRMRRDYLTRWIANPKRFLPYTAMPVNIPPDKPVSQQLYHGTSREQIEGLVDLLLNYDRYAESQFKPSIPPPGTAKPNDGAKPDNVKPDDAAKPDAAAKAEDGPAKRGASGRSGAGAANPK